MEASIAIPAEVQQLADSMGVDVQALVAGNPQLQAALASAQQQAAPPAAAAAQGAVPGVAAGHVPPAGTQVAEGVQASPAETPEEKLQRELAVAQQELQQTRQHMQTMQEGRVIGNSGVPGQGTTPPPSLATLEPGLRWAVRNGIVAIESIADPLIKDLFAADKGGVI
jgi:hypothetical protein